MIPTEHLAAFLVASLTLMFIPGPDLALVTRQVIVHGRRVGFLTVGGLVVGGLLHLTLAVFGLSAALATSSHVYTAVKIVGALYLVFLGITFIRTAAARDVRDQHAASERLQAPTSSYSRGHPLMLGLASNATNPKVAMFFLTYLPQFVPASGSAPSALAGLGSLFIMIATAWWIGYILLLDRLSRWLYRPRVRSLLEVVSGAALLLIGLRLALQQG